MTRRTNLGLEALELRENPTVVPVLNAGVLTITSNDEGDHVSVTSVINTIWVGVGLTPFAYGYDYSSVTKIVFVGNGGDDSFSNSTDKPLEAYGGAGDDTLAGGTAADHLYGGGGLDTLIGGAGDDYLSGGADGEADSLTGGSGADTFVREVVTLPSGLTFNRDTPLDYSFREGDQMITLRYLPPPPIGVYVPPL